MAAVGAIALVTIFLATPAAAGSAAQDMGLKEFFELVYPMMADIVDANGNSANSQGQGVGSQGTVTSASYLNATKRDDYANARELYDAYKASINNDRFKDAKKFKSLLWVLEEDYDTFTLNAKAHKIYICHGSASHYIGINVDFNSLVNSPTGNGHFNAQHNDPTKNKLNDFLLSMQGISDSCNPAGSPEAAAEIEEDSNKDVCGNWIMFVDDDTDPVTTIYKVTGDLALANTAADRETWSIIDAETAYAGTQVVPGTFPFGTVTADGVEFSVGDSNVFYPYKCECCA